MNIRPQLVLHNNVGGVSRPAELSIVCKADSATGATEETDGERGGCTNFSVEGHL